jgi:hypothetical protein
MANHQKHPSKRGLRDRDYVACHEGKVSGSANGTDAVVPGKAFAVRVYSEAVKPIVIMARVTMKPVKPIVIRAKVTTIEQPPIIVHVHRQTNTPETITTQEGDQHVLGNNSTRRTPMVRASQT